METAEIKLEIFRYIDNLENYKLKKIYDLLFSNQQKDKADFWDNLSDLEKKDIELGIKDLDEGKSKNFDAFIQK